MLFRKWDCVMGVVYVLMQIMAMRKRRLLCLATRAEETRYRPTEPERSGDLSTDFSLAPVAELKMTEDLMECPGGSGLALGTDCATLHSSVFEERSSGERRTKLIRLGEYTCVSRYACSSIIRKN